MTVKTPLIGFDRYVDIEWCHASFDVALDVITPEQLKAQVALALPGTESQRKTLDILKRMSTKPFSHLTDFINRGLKIYRATGSVSVLPLAWGGAIASYSFFGKTAETTGRLLSLQGDCYIKEILRRIAEAYGDRHGIERAVTRVLQSQANWGVFGRDETAKRILKFDPKIIDSDELTAWLIEAAVRYAGKPISIPSLRSLHVLFPFTLTRPLAYIVSDNPNLELRSEGPNNQFVTLRSAI